jgi:TatD DNase family protein
MQLIDTHVHLNFEAFEPDFESVVQRWRDNGVVRLVHSCVEPSEFKAIQALAHRYPELFFAVGLHPLDASQWVPGMEQEIRTLVASDPKAVAIGETGLDFYKADNCSQQSEALLAHLRVAKALDLPVILHCRDAAESMAQLLRQFWQEQGPVKGVMHCWGGTPEQTQWFLDLGFYVSFSGTVTFKKAAQIHESAQMVPIERLLVETDCPFLAPVPKRGERRNEPANVYYVAQRVAELRNMRPEDLAAQTTENACRLFKLPLPNSIQAAVAV